jgi:hypothetical protein
MNYDDLSQPARDLLLAMAEGQELKHGWRNNDPHYWEINGKYVDATMGPQELQDQGLIELYTLGAAARERLQVIRLTPLGWEVAKQLRGER